jgi:hypothetical protein
VRRGRIRLECARAAAQAKARQQVERADDDFDQPLNLARAATPGPSATRCPTSPRFHPQLGRKAKAAALEREAETRSLHLLDTTPPDPNPFTWVYESWSRRQNPAAAHGWKRH